MWFPRQEYWHKLPFTSSGDSPDPEGIEPTSPVLSIAKSCPTLYDPGIAAHQASLSFTIFRSFLKLMSTESVMPSNPLILFHPFLLLSSILPNIKIFSNELALSIRWPKFWSFSFSISLSNEYSGLISFRIDWFDLLLVHGTLRNLEHHSLRWILYHWATWEASNCPQYIANTVNYKWFGGLLIISQMFSGVFSLLLCFAL